MLLAAAKSIPELSFGGVWGRSETNAAEIVRLYGGRAYRSYDELLSDSTIEAVLLPTPHFLHFAQSIAALSAGKHVFVEKPIAPTFNEAEMMARASLAKGLVLAVGHQVRFMGFARRIRDMLADQTFGVPSHIVITHGYPLMLGAEQGDWRLRPENVPGGPLDEFGVHYFDALSYWCGPALRVTGAMTSKITPGEVPDVASVVIELSNGVLASYTSHFVSVGVNRLQFFGTNGRLEVNRFGAAESWWQDTGDMTAARMGGPPPKPVSFPEPVGIDGALRAELIEFFSAIRQRRPPEVGAPQAIAALRIARAAVQAFATGRSVTI